MGTATIIVGALVIVPMALLLFDLVHHKDRAAKSESAH
jgi:hypothetical protein